MKKILDAELSVNTMKLEQKGGKVKIIKSKTCYVKFMVNGMKLSYVYNINKDGKFFLERVSPYPLPVREFDMEGTVVDLILFDVEQFRNASKSKNIQEFIDVSLQINKTVRSFEHLFLYYNVEKERLTELHNKLNEIKELITDVRESSERIYYDEDSPLLRNADPNERENMIGVYYDCF